MTEIINDYSKIRFQEFKKKKPLFISKFEINFQFLIGRYIFYFFVRLFSNGIVLHQSNVSMQNTTFESQLLRSILTLGPDFLDILNEMLKNVRSYIYSKH